MWLKWTTKIIRSTWCGKTITNPRKAFLTTKFSGPSRLKTLFMSKVLFHSLTVFWMVIMEQYLRTDKPVVERLTLWWEFLTINNSKALFHELLAKLSLWPRMTPAKPISFVAVLSKYTMKKFMISSAKIPKLECSSRKALKKASLSRISAKSKSTPSPTCKNTWKSGSKTEPPEPPTWTLNHPDRTVFSVFILTRKNKTRKGMKSTKLLNSTWSTWQVLKEPAKPARLAMVWSKLLKLTCPWVLWVMSFQHWSMERLTTFLTEILNSHVCCKTLSVVTRKLLWLQQCPLQTTTTMKL